MIFIKNTFKICFVILGAIIGAGFASGKEIYSFFCIYNIHGILGIFISSYLIWLIVSLTFKVIINNNITSYSEFVTFLVGSKKVVSYTINYIMNVFLFIFFIVMVAGFSSMFKQEFNMPNLLGGLLICFFVFICLSKNIEGIIKVNSLLMPALIFLIVLLFFKCNIKSLYFYSSFTIQKKGWLINSLFYASYNSIVLIPILINLKPLINNKKQVKYITLFVTFVILVLSLTIFSILHANLVEIKMIEIPLVFIASKFGVFYKYLYGLIILIAIFTTAICTGFSFVNNIAKNKKQYYIFSIIICITGIVFSNIGFSTLLNLLYPILGLLGFIEVLILLYKYFTFKKST